MEKLTEKQKLMLDTVKKYLAKYDEFIISNNINYKYYRKL